MRKRQTNEAALSVAVPELAHRSGLCVAYGELVAACCSRAGLHCVESIQLLLLRPPPARISSPTLALFTSPALACSVHSKTCLTLLRKHLGRRCRCARQSHITPICLMPTADTHRAPLSYGYSQRQQISADAVMSGNVKGLLIAP